MAIRRGFEVNKCYYENCMATMLRMPDSLVDLVVTSPPYDKQRDYEGFEMDLKVIVPLLHKKVVQGGVVVWVVGDSTTNGSESGNSFKQALLFMHSGFRLHDTMIYQKINYTPLTHNRYEQSFEYMFVFSKGRPNTFNPLMIPCKQAGKIEKYGNERRQNHGANHAMRLYNATTYKATNDTKIAPNIFSYSCGREKTGHPAPFPELLAQDQILSWSDELDIVYDPFAGSGTTLKMAKKNNRVFIGSEIAMQYASIIEPRIK